MANSPTRLMEPNDFVRLRRYRWQSSSELDSQRNEFVAAWRKAAQTATDTGVIYRELCEKVPESSTTASGDAPQLQCQFLEYILLSPDSDPEGVTRVSTGSLSGCEVSESLHRVSSRILKGAAATASQIVKYKVFGIARTPAARHGLLMSWPAHTRALLDQSPVDSTALYECWDVNGSYTAFERAELLGSAGESSDAGDAPRRAPIPRPDVPAVTTDEGVFRIIASVERRRSPARQSMMAVRFHQFGGPEVLVYEQMPRPRPGPRQVLIRVAAVAINHLDCLMRAGTVQRGFPAWFPDIPGHTLAGTVAELGPGCARRRIGEQVYATIGPLIRRAYAEYVVAAESFFHPKPTNMSFAEASVAASVFATAHAALFTRKPLKSGDRILIHGASGAVGTYAVQMAKDVGAFVIGTASARNHGALKALGADKVIDYNTERFEEVCGPVDFVLDCMGGETRERSWALIARGGALATLVSPPPDEGRAAQLGVEAFMVFGHPDVGSIMADMSERHEQGRLLPPVIAATFPLRDAAAAHAYMQTQSVPGRVVLTVGSEAAAS